MINAMSGLTTLHWRIEHHRAVQQQEGEQEGTDEGGVGMEVESSTAVVAAGWVI